jgi:hypothetical protein
MTRTHRFPWFRKSIIPLVCLLSGLLLILTATPSRMGAGPLSPQDTGTGHHGQRPQVPDNSLERNSPPALTAKQKAALMKNNFDKTKDDAAELADLANGLRDELNKTNINILSIDVIHRAEKIEKLAKKIKDEAKGY